MKLIERVLRRWFIPLAEVQATITNLTTSVNHWQDRAILNAEECRRLQDALDVLTEGIARIELSSAPSGDGNLDEVEFLATLRISRYVFLQTPNKEALRRALAVQLADRVRRGILKDAPVEWLR